MPATLFLQELLQESAAVNFSHGFVLPHVYDRNNFKMIKGFQLRIGSQGIAVIHVETDKGVVWVIRETEFNLMRPLRFDDVFDFSIWLMEWRRVRGTRGFNLQLSESGELVAQGAQKVVSLDAASMRPVTPPERFMESFRLEEPLII